MQNQSTLNSILIFQTFYVTKTNKKPCHLKIGKKSMLLTAFPVNLPSSNWPKVKIIWGCNPARAHVKMKDGSHYAWSLFINALFVQKNNLFTLVFNFINIFLQYIVSRFSLIIPCSVFAPSGTEDPYAGYRRRRVSAVLSVSLYHSRRIRFPSNLRLILALS